MIQNERQFRITKAQADKFRRAIETARQESPPKGVHPKAHKLTVDAMLAQLADLERELRDYAALKSGQVKKHLEGSLEQLGEILVKARIARGWSQRELAERLDLHMQKIQEYEATTYERASATRLLDVARALGLVLHLRGELLELPQLPTRQSEKMPAGTSARGIRIRE